MGNVISDSDVKVKTLIEYLRVQGRQDIADLLVDAKITVEPGATLLGILFNSRDYELYLNVSPTVFHTIQTQAEIKKLLKESFLAVVPQHQGKSISKFGFRMLSV